jgi:hypothetical protein
MGKNMFLLQAILSCFCSKFQESYMPPAIRVRVNHPTYIVSDNNINLLNFPKYDHSKYFLHSLHSNGFLLTNFKATHLQNDSFLLINNIFSNNIISHTENGTVIGDFSDHFIHFIQIPFPNSNKSILLNLQGNSSLKI